MHIVGPSRKYPGSPPIAPLACSAVRARTATWALTGIRPTAKGNRAVVDSSIDVFNQRDELVMNHAARRLLAGRAPG